MATFRKRYIYSLERFIETQEYNQTSFQSLFLKCRPQNRLFWKKGDFIKSGVQEVQRAQNRLFQIENSSLHQISCLGGAESSKLAILDGKQLFISNQVFRRSRELKLSYFSLKKTAVYIKSGVWEVQRAQNRTFQMEKSC